MLSLTSPPSTIMWMEGRRMMSEKKFKKSVSPLLGALMTSPPGDSTQKFNILLDLGYSIAKTDELKYARQYFLKAFEMIQYAPSVSRKAELYTLLTHCYLEQLIDTFDYDKKQMFGYQALACVAIVKEYYHDLPDKKNLYAAKELEEEVRREINEFGIEEF